MTTFFRRWTARCWLRMHALTGEYIRPGSLLRLDSFDIEEAPITTTYLWRAEKGRGRALVLVSAADGRRVLLTRTRSSLLAMVEEPAWLKIEQYAELLRWFERAGWGVCIERPAKPADRDGGMVVFTQHEWKRRGGSAYFDKKTTTKLRSSERGIQLMLTMLLFEVCHPIKAARLEGKKEEITHQLKLLVQRQRRMDAQERTAQK